MIKIFGPLAFKYRSPEACQPVGDLAGFQVAALHGIAMVKQHFGNAGHTDAADAHKVNGAKFDGQFGGIHADSFPGGGGVLRTADAASPSARSASAFAASGRP